MANMSNPDDEYDYIDLEPNHIHLMNLHSIIYNRPRQNPMNLLEGVNPSIPNDTNDNQESLNDILVEHVQLMSQDPDRLVVIRADDEEEIPPSSSDRRIYLLKDGDKSICYSGSRYVLLICGSNLMSEKNEYGKNMDIVPI